MNNYKTVFHTNGDYFGPLKLPPQQASYGQVGGGVVGRSSSPAHALHVRARPPKTAQLVAANPATAAAESSGAINLTVGCFVFVGVLIAAAVAVGLVIPNYVQLPLTTNNITTATTSNNSTPTTAPTATTASATTGDHSTTSLPSFQLGNTTASVAAAGNTTTPSTPGNSTAP